MQRWSEREKEVGGGAQSVLSYCLQMVLPLLLIKEGVSDLLNRMNTAYKTGDYQLTVSKNICWAF